MAAPASVLLAGAVAWLARRLVGDPSIPIEHKRLQQIDHRCTGIKPISFGVGRLATHPAQHDLQQKSKIEKHAVPPLVTRCK